MSFKFLERVDIVIATYQGSFYLKEQIQSILTQSHLPFHIMIRDDGSTDQTRDIIQTFLRNYPEKISFINSEERLGTKKNFSTLLQQAKANYIMLCDQDDVWLPNKIEMCLSKMKEMESQYGSQTPLMVHSDLTVVDKNLNVLHPSFWNFSKLKPKNANSLNRLLAHNVVTGCSMMINKPLLNLATPIPEEAVMHDWWFALVASALGRIGFIPISMTLYRQHGKNEVGAKNWKTLAAYLPYIKKVFYSSGRLQIRQQLKKTIDQAAYFLNKYENLLELNKKNVVKNFVALGTGGPIQKRYLFLTHRYFKNTLLKNMGLFFLLN